LNATDNDTTRSSTTANTEGIKCGGRRKGSTIASVTENKRKREDVTYNLFRHITSHATGGLRKTLPGA